MDVDLVVLQATVRLRMGVTLFCSIAPRSTGAKGLNLAATDVTVLAAGLVAFYKRNCGRLLDEYSSQSVVGPRRR